MKRKLTTTTTKKQLFFLFLNFFLDIQAVTLISDTTHVQKITEQQLELNQQLHLTPTTTVAWIFTNLKLLFFLAVYVAVGFLQNGLAPVSLLSFSVHEPRVRCVRWPS